MDDHLIGLDASLMEAATQTTSTAMSGVELTSPVAPPDQTEQENWYVLFVTASIMQLNLETTSVILGEMVTASPNRSAFWNPQMAAIFSGPVPARRAINDQGAIVKELERNNAE